jgi:hypothetical protein
MENELPEREGNDQGKRWEKKRLIKKNGKA